MPPSIQEITRVTLYFLPVQTRVPLKFGAETLTSVTCARVALEVVDTAGNRAIGWGETPLSVQWSWPGSEPYEVRHAEMRNCCEQLAQKWLNFKGSGHALEVGWKFQEQVIGNFLGEPARWGQHAPPHEGGDRRAEDSAPYLGKPGAVPARLPYLAALVCNSPFDLALHDAYGRLAGRPVYETYTKDFPGPDLSHYLEPAKDTAVSFRGLYPSDFLMKRPAMELPAWHLVGGLDPLDAAELTGNEPNDGEPVLLTDWIRRDGLTCLKVKLRGTDAAWDYSRLARVGGIGLSNGVEHLSADFNCTVHVPEYVNEVLDRLRMEHPAIYDRILYVEQPFPYELREHPIDVHSVSKRKALFLDESAHDWRQVGLGRELGWTGVALKTCKTQTGAILSACWARAHGMALMVQDLTNPMLAQIPHVLLAAHVGTIMGVETNGMQFYPAASIPEARIHPGIYRRRNGRVDLTTLAGPGFGYRVEEINRELPAPALDLAQ